MKVIRYLLVASESILAHKMRAILTMLGIIIGVGAVTSMVGLGQGLSADIMQEVESGGPNTISISGGFGEDGGLTNGDVHMIANSSFTPNVTDVAAGYQNSAAVIYKDVKAEASVTGVTQNYFNVSGVKIDKGRSFTVEDIENRSHTAILGVRAAKNLFRSENPVGQSIRIKQETFLVVGVLKEVGGFDFNGSDSQVFVPLPVAQSQLFNASRRNGERAVSNIVALATDIDAVKDAKRQIEVTLRLRHNLGTKDRNDFMIFDQVNFLKMAKNISRTMTAFLGFMGAISLLVGGIGIMNIMLVSVTERTREIGLRKAIGAHNSDILLQFLTEAVVLCLFGGAIGIGLAYGVSAIVKQFATPEMPIKIIIQLNTILLALGVSAASGIIFGTYPAMRATRLDPIEALRHE